MKIIKKVTLLVLVIFVAMQFFHPEKNQAQGNHTSQFITETNPPKHVKMVLRETCYNCHSNNTQYPWYNNISPVSFWLAGHVEEGKKHLNFSDWKNYSDIEKDHKFDELFKMVENEEMPLKEYTWSHEEANLTNKQRKAITKWALQTRILYQLNQRPE